MSVYAIALLAALLHAAWNAIVKAGDDKRLTTALIACMAGVAAASVLPFVAQPAKESWPFVAASLVLQVAYFELVARTYRVAGMGRTYPVMRGTAPLLVAIAGIWLLDDRPSGTALAGIVAICAGILCMAARRHPGVIAALRETSILFGTLIAGFVLGAPLTPVRIAGACIIALGATALQLSQAANT